VLTRGQAIEVQRAYPGSRGNGVGDRGSRSARAVEDLWRERWRCAGVHIQEQLHDPKPDALSLHETEQGGGAVGRRASLPGTGYGLRATAEGTSCPGHKLAGGQPDRPPGRATLPPGSNADQVAPFTYRRGGQGGGQDHGRTGTAPLSVSGVIVVRGDLVEGSGGLRGRSDPGGGG